MGVIVACGFYAKPSMLICFSRKTLDCSTAKLLCLAFSSLWTLNKRFTQINLTRNPEGLPDPLNNRVGIKYDRFRIV